MPKSDAARARITKAKQEEWAEQDKRDVDAAFSSLLQHKVGRRFLWWTLQIGRVGIQPFDGNPVTMAFNCGELNVGQQLLARLIEADPQGYLTMQQENANVHTERNEQLNALLRSDDDTSGASNVGDDDGLDAYFGERN